MHLFNLIVHLGRIELFLKIVKFSSTDLKMTPAKVKIHFNYILSRKQDWLTIPNSILFSQIKIDLSLINFYEYTFICLSQIHYG